MPKGKINTFVHPAWRPPKYGPEILKKTLAYIKSCEDGYKRVPYINEVGRKRFREKFVVKIPTLEGLAVVLDVHKETIQDWKKKHVDFSVLVSRMLSIQGDRVINKGLSGDYNSAIAKIVGNKHGYRDGVDLANPDGSNLFRPADKDRDEAAKALKEL